MNDFLTGTPDLSVELGKIKLKNPVVTCSGTFASGLEYSDFYDLSLLGAITTKSFSIERVLGNPPPRICETASGLINSIGLQNEGIENFINKQLKKVKKLGTEIILSIFGKDIEDFKKVALKIKSISKDLIAVELNFSCPNVKDGGMAFCAFPDQIYNVVYEIKTILDIPLIAKLSINYNTLIDAAFSAKSAGAEAVSIINTIPATALDINTFKPKIGNIIGGLSGPAIKPIAVLKVYELAREKMLPIIGMGGISCWEDALEFIIAGASAIGIGTANFILPDCGKRVIDGLTSYMTKKNISNIKKLIGIAIKDL